MSNTNINPQELVNDLTARAKDAGGQILNTVSGLLGKDSETQFVEIIIMMMIAIVVVLFVFWAYSLTSLQNADCQRLDTIYQNTQGSASTRSIANFNPAYNSDTSGVPQYSANNYSVRSIWRNGSHIFILREDRI